MRDESELIGIGSEEVSKLAHERTRGNEGSRVTFVSNALR